MRPSRHLSCPFYNCFVEVSTHLDPFFPPPVSSTDTLLSILRRCFRASYYYLDDPTSLSVPTACDWDQQKENGVNTAIPINMFAKHVASLHADSDIGFSKEYDTIQSSSIEGHTVINSQLPDNKTKNRYLNILACKQFGFSKENLNQKNKITTEAGKCIFYLKKTSSPSLFFKQSR